MRPSVSRYATRFTAKEIKVTYHVRMTDPTVFGDQQLLKSAMEHLIVNALTYSNAGGEVDVTLTEKDNMVTFKVKDTGIGIPSNDQKRIFQLFYRGSNAVTQDTEGYGLGLFLAKTYIELHGGKISFTSKENKGTEIQFTIPRKHA